MLDGLLDDHYHFEWVGRHRRERTDVKPCDGGGSERVALIPEDTR
jgi:hypothetical protein